jgi:hypothetical protein
LDPKAQAMTSKVTAGGASFRDQSWMSFQATFARSMTWTVAMAMMAV